MKIAIDARKWRDYGIGTYVRNLVRHLARLDRETTYFLFCNAADEATLRDLAENFVPVVDDSAGYSLQEHISIPLKLRRLGADLLHSPHYVLPLFCRDPVGRHHPRLHPPALPGVPPQPHGLALRAVHDGPGDAAAARSCSPSPRPRAATSCASIPGRIPDSVQVVPNAIDADLLEDPGEEEMERVRERYQIRGRFVLYAGNIKPHKNLERLIAAFGLLKQRPGHEDLKLLIIGDEVNRYGSLRRSVEGRGRPPGRALLRLRARSDPGRPLPHGLRLRLPVAVRGLRPAAARGHGLRHARRHLAHLLAARGGGRRGHPRRSLQRRGHRAGACAGPARTARSARPRPAGPRAGQAASAGSARCAAIHAGYMKVLGATRPRGGRPRDALTRTAP